MTHQEADWKRHEKEVNEQLSIADTLASGRFWGDKGDGATYEHVSDSSRFQLQVDEKCTTHKTYKLDSGYMKACVERAAAEGKIFVLPVRFQISDEESEWQDYAVLTLKDFKFMLGFDQLKSLKGENVRLRKAFKDMKKSLSSQMEEIDELASSINLTAYQKMKMYELVDSFDKAMKENDVS